MILPFVMQMAFAALPVADSLPLVVANDNRIAAGMEQEGIRRIRLVVKMGRWFPEDSGGPSVVAPFFAEEDGAPRVPGPLVRVRTGTMLEITIRNALPDSAIIVSGLLTRPAARDSGLRVPAGQSHTVRFTAGAPGSYLYFARPAGHKSDIAETEQLSGALIVDDEGPSRPDRVFVINIWGTLTDSVTYRNALAINGRSWPYTERLRGTVGDTVRWRVLNGSEREHPMHLHGFYFRVDAKGTWLRDSVYAPGQQRLAVTESLQRFRGMTMTWAPDRPGNWLFHCHLGFHVIPEARLEPPKAGDYHDQLSHDAARHMAGLVLGIEVPEPPGWREPERRKTRRLHLYIQEGKRRSRAERNMGFVLKSDRQPAIDSVAKASTVLVLRRGEPTDITVVNRLKESAAVHWHGIELESFSDGVAGWSGTKGRVAPVIAPNDSFVARLTLPRAGTFIYHTHLNDLQQITSGLYGAIVVTEPDVTFDQRRDHVVLVGWDSPADPPHLLVNGDSAAGEPLQWNANETHRLRLINIGVAGPVRFKIGAAADTSAPASWRTVAKDGADLPAGQQVTGPARRGLTVGETADVELALPAGEYEFSVAFASRAPRYRQRIVVR